MKKIYLIAMTLVLALIMTSCTSSELSDNYTEEEAIQLGKRVVEMVNKKEYQKLNDMVRADLKEQLSIEVFETNIGPFVDSAANFEEFQTETAVGVKDEKTQEDYVTVVLVCNYENKNRTCARRSRDGSHPRPSRGESSR